MKEIATMKQSKTYLKDLFAVSYRISHITVILTLYPIVMEGNDNTWVVTFQRRFLFSTSLLSKPFLWKNRSST